MGKSKENLEITNSSSTFEFLFDSPPTEHILTSYLSLICFYEGCPQMPDKMEYRIIVINSCNSELLLTIV